MTETMYEFITRRKAEIKEQQAALRKELQEIKAAEAAISGDESAAPRQRKKASSGPTIKEMIVKTLEAKSLIDGQGADALQILDLIKEMYGKEVSRPSLSPQLSRLKSDGTLNLDDKIWTLASADAPKKEAPEGASNSEGTAIPSPVNQDAPPWAQSWSGGNK